MIIKQLSVFLENREGLIIGSACEAGELYQAILKNESMDEVTRLCEFYDYYEIQYHKDKENLQPRYNQFLYKLSQKYNKPLVATGDSHSVSQYKAECRKILLVLYP